MDAEPRLGHRLAEEADVEVALPELGGLGNGGDLVQRQAHPGVRRAEGLQEIRHHHQHPDHRVADVQRPQLPAPDRVNAVRPTLDLAERLASGFQERRAGLGQLDVTAGSEKQARPDGLLQDPDLLAQKRLGDAEAGGRAPEVQLVGEDGEVSEGGEAQAISDIHIDMNT